jgi:hypothetical protein
MLWIRIGFNGDGLEIQLFISIRIRIQGDKPTRIHADPWQAIKSLKVTFLHEKYTESKQ